MSALSEALEHSQAKALTALFKAYTRREDEPDDDLFRGVQPAQELHHVVSRGSLGDDVADNLVPLCRECHHDLTVRVYGIGAELMRLLTDAEYAYMIERGGEHYPERAYGVRYGR